MTIGGSGRIRPPGVEEAEGNELRSQKSRSVLITTETTSSSVRESAPSTVPLPLTIDPEVERLQDAGRVREPTRRAWDTKHAANLGDRIFLGITTVFAGLILLILAAILGVLLVQSRQNFQHTGWQFITSATWDPIHNIYGASPAIFGTTYTSLLALLIAAPIGVMVAVFLTDMSPRRLRFPVGFLIELLAAVPSIVFGLWAMFVLVPVVRDYVEPFFMGHFGAFPLFQGYPIGLGFLTASLILAIMILPTIAAISRDVMLAVPINQREAMLALGATKWETVQKVVIPAARSGIVGGIILALGRAIGETMAVQMVIGNTPNVTLGLFNFGTTMPATIVNQFTEATGDVYRSALIELALVLMVVTILLNAIARVLVWRVTQNS